MPHIGEHEKHTVSNPHPGFGTDPNIKNEFGHTHYPKWVDHHSDEVAKTKAGKPIMARVLVNDEAEEAEATGKLANKKTGASAENTKGWAK